MDINLKNIEELIFFDKKIKGLFPEFQHLFDQWQLSKMIPGMDSLGKRSILDLMNSLEPRHIAQLEEYFQDTILLDKVDHHIVRHFEGPADSAENLCEFSGYREFCISRHQNNMKVTFWR